MKKPKVLVANRSEIACRIFQTCREMGLSTVGIFAPGDEEARHLTFADEVHEISHYLDIHSLVQVAKQSGASLVHPGYGFLSERPGFARAIEEAGLTFIGPRPETMELMGGKIAAKELAASLNVPTLPWCKVKAGENIESAAQKVGFPILLKASAGGGGKGMRKVDTPEQLVSAAESASAEAMSAFGDGTLFLERYVARPRQIEVQVFGDGHGNGVHLFERECSLQRRHQKLWEESPAPHLSQATREALCAAALRLVQATRYRNAGTIEFLLSPTGEFYFLEMNTRLQVEHPVTEMVSGIDLVWAQIEQAQAPHETILNLDSILPSRGHAIEVRLYAEDPAQGFIPRPGRIEKLIWPTGSGIRIESGIEEGQTVGIQFDSMLAKLIVYAPDRNHALKRLRFALEETVILGVGTNQNYFLHLARHPQVQEGRVDTGFLEREMAQFNPLPPQETLEILTQAHEKGWGGHSTSSVAQSSHPSPWSTFSKRGKVL